MRLARLVLPVLIAIIAACTQASPVGEDATAKVFVDLGALTVSPGSASLGTGRSLQLSAVARDARGGAVLGIAVIWTSSDNNIAQVSSTGLVTGVGSGVVTITATSGGLTSTSTISVLREPAAAVQIIPASLALFSGTTTQLAAEVRDSSGAILTNRVVSWSTSDASVATISEGGLLTAAGPGTASIIASVDGQIATAPVVVSLIPTVSVVLTPASAALQVGQTTAFTASPRDSAGNTLSSRVVSWQVSDPTVVSLSSSGAVAVATALAAGSATVTATVEGQSASAPITVTPVPVASVALDKSTLNLNVGGTGQVVASMFAADGSPLSGRVPTWSSSSPAVASVSSTGLVTGLALGTTVVTATIEGRSASVTVNVVPLGDPVPSITPPTAAIFAGQSLQLSAQLLDAGGNPVAATFVWSTGNASVAGVSQTGLVTGVFPGTVTITATTGGKSAAATVTVLPAAVSSISVTPSPAAVAVRQTVQLIATPFDVGGAALSGRPVSWTSSNAFIAAVSPTGLVSGLAEGTVTVTATIEGKVASTTVTVGPAAVASITVTPAASTIFTGGTVLLTATARDALGVILPGRLITWSSNNSGIAVVDARGQVFGVSAGGVTILASSGGVTGAATVTVTLPPIETLTITPASAAVPVGGAVQFTAVARDVNGDVLSNRAITWTSSAPGVATISSTGMARALSAGVTVITAQAEGQSATARLTVSAAGVASVSVTPASSTMAIAATTQLTAVTMDAAGNPLVGRVISWRSSDTTIATVSPTGQVTGVAAGTSTITAESEGQQGTATVTISSGGGTGGVGTVTSVSVTPSTATLAAGGTLQIAATARDAGGLPVIGPPATWSTSNPSIALVTQSGLVSGVAAGTVTISVTIDGQVGRVTITVTSSSTLFPNEPAGFTKYSERDFSAKNQDGWFAIEQNYASLQVVQDATAPKSGPMVMQQVYPVGFPSGSAPAVAERQFTTPATQLYISVWLKLSANWDGHVTGTNKMFYVWVAGKPKVFLSAEGAGAGPLEPQVRLQNDLAQRGRLRPNLARTLLVQRGVWQRWELVLRANTPGQANGEVHWWIDGVKVSEYRDVQIVDAGESPNWEQFQWRPIWGGGGPAISQEQTLRFDHLYLSLMR